MLAADKLQLQSHVKQQATALKEKEFNLHHSNLMTVGTQAAVLAGLDITMFIEFHPAADDEWQNVSGHKYIFLIPRFLKCCYYMTIVSAFCANILVVAQTTVLSVMGASLALRGPDGSMMTATNGIYEERMIVFQTFGYGLLATLISVILCVWLICSFEASLICNLCSMGTIYVMMKHFKRIRRKFMYNEEDTVDFTDLFHAGGGGLLRSKKEKKKRMVNHKKNICNNKSLPNRNRQKYRNGAIEGNIDDWSSQDEYDEDNLYDDENEEEEDIYNAYNNYTRKRRARRVDGTSGDTYYSEINEDDDSTNGNNRRERVNRKERNDDKLNVV